MRERYGVEPSQVPDLIALRGDPSDAIPGANGIGAVSAADLLRRYGTLEGVIEHAVELTPRQRESVIGAADDLRGYLQVATMRRDLPVPELPDSELDAERAAAGPRRAGSASCRAASAGACGLALDSLRMRPDSLLIRGAGDRGRRGALAGPRSLDVVRALGEQDFAVRTRGVANERPRRRRCSASSSRRRCATFASGMTAWSIICIAVLQQGSVLVIPDSGYYEVELLAAGPLAASASRRAATAPPMPTAFAEACRGPRSRSSRPRPTP